jgi:acyl-CoA-dependent ceramide synthase
MFSDTDCFLTNLQTAKILRYLGHETACNVTFGLFVATWFVARHVLYPQLCWSIFTIVPRADTMLYGCYSGTTDALLPEIPAQPDYFSHLFWPLKDMDGVICLNKEVKWIFLGMLLMLQVLSMIWFGMIIKVIIGILRGGSAEDTRSDDEGEEEEEAEIHDYDDLTSKKRAMNVTDLNVCVDGSGATISNNRRMATLSPKPTQVSARRRLMHGEKRKELLARIGCEKPVHDSG